MIRAPFQTLLTLCAACAISGAQVPAGSTLLLDDFTHDTSLNQDLWAVNAPPLPRLAAAEINGIQGLVTPQITFSKAGMSVSGVSAIKEFAGIKSKQLFTPPFTVQATVMGVVAHANPFALYLIAPADSQHLRITGNINPENTGAYKIAVNTKGAPAETLVGNPSVNKWYTLTVAVDKTGHTEVRVADEAGNTIGKADGPLPVGPMFVAMVQSEPNPRTVGPNEAVWRRIAVMSGTAAGSQTVVAPEKVTVKAPAQLPPATYPLNTGNVVADASGNIYVAAMGADRIVKVDPKTGLVTKAADLAGLPPFSPGPLAIALDKQGDLYIGQIGIVRKVDARTGAMSTVAGIGGPFYSGDGGPATRAAISVPVSLAVDGAGNLYICDATAKRVRKVDAKTGIITTVAGNGTAEPRTDGVVATNSGMDPILVAVDSAGRLYIMDAIRATQDLSLRVVEPGTGIITSIGGSGLQRAPWAKDPSAMAVEGGRGLAVDGSGNVYVESDYRIWRLAAGTRLIGEIAGDVAPDKGSRCEDGTPAIRCRVTPYNLAADAEGNLYFLTEDGTIGNKSIRKISAETGILSTVIASGEAAPPGSGTVVQPTGTAPPAGSAPLSVTTVARVGTPQLSCVKGLAVDRGGDLYISDCDIVRKLTVRTGAITNVAGSPDVRQDNFGVGTVGDGGPAKKALISPGRLALDREGNLFIAEAHTVRRVDAKTGIIATFAGSRSPYEVNLADEIPATSRMLTIAGLAADTAGNVYLTGDPAGKILKVTARTGRVAAVATMGTNAVGPGAGSIAVDSTGAIYFSVPGLNTIRKIAARDDAVTRIAGVSQDGYSGLPRNDDGHGASGDGGPGDHARLNRPSDLALDASGNLYIADSGNHSVRMVAVGTGIISTVFRMDDPKFGKSTLGGPDFIAVDQSGNLYVEGNGAIFRVSLQQ